MMQKILIIEKKMPARQFLMQLLKKNARQLFSVEDGTGALRLLQSHSFDLIFSDFKGIEILKHSNRRPLKTPLIFLRELDEKQRKDVDATIDKPLEPNILEKILTQISSTQNDLTHVVAESEAMKQILSRVEKISKSHSNLFICGESGTGKEVIASMIHTLSKRSLHPFIRVNCAALSDTLIESEFFGHEKGAFTGAHTKRIGRFELAHGGTLLLDEISEISVPLQAKLLRVVQEQEFERVGSTEPISIDVRLISTSNKNMKEAMQQREFRQDLYYRLNIIPLHLPPLRKRKEDILPLAKLFLEETCQKNQLPLKELSEQAQEKLLACKWPGNIRQLRNVIEHSVIMSDADCITKGHVLLEEWEEGSEHSFVEMPLKTLEKQHILATVKACHNNRTHAAKKLGISVRTLRNKLKGYSHL